MSFQNIKLVNVYFAPNQTKQLIGRLALKDRQIFFEYDSVFLKSNLELSPFKLPLKPGVTKSDPGLFDGLFGVFNDSLPDGWGRLLLDRKLTSLGISPGQVSPLDRLCYVGKHGMGALIYEPELENSYIDYLVDLDQLAHESYEFQETYVENYIDELLAMNGSSAGARPKILINIKNDHYSFKPGSNNWIIKFRSNLDPKDIGSIEFAYHLMAQKAGIVLPEAKLFPSKNSTGYFGAKRFDQLDGKRFHMHSICGLLHADYRIPSLDYSSTMKTTWLLTKDIHQCQQLFRLACFNVLSHNRDDHSKNFSYLMDESGKWTLSPAYDLTFSSGPAGEHCTTIIGEGKNPRRTHLLKLARIGDIEERTANSIIDQVIDITSNWQNFAAEAFVTNSSMNQIELALKKVREGF